MRLHPRDAEAEEAEMQRLNAAKAEAVLAFADALDAERPAASIHRFQHRAAQFLAAQGWSETPGQAERGKP